MSRSLHFFWSFVPLVAFSQTGPGGIGTNANNVLWLDANYGVTHSSGSVSAWSDRSGNANNAAYPPAIPTSLPTRVTNSVNGYPSLDFDGVDDQLWVSDHSTLDLTQWHAFIVVIADLLKDYNAWVVKGSDNLENYEMLSYSDGNIHTPIRYTDATRTFPSSSGGQVTTSTFNIFEYSYSSAAGRDVWKNSGSSTIITDNENKTPATNNFPLYIANERSTTGREVNGDIAEVILYNAPLNSAQRVIVNNYLAAKYDRALGTNDLYVEDGAINGNYDHDVAGIGRINASNQQDDSYGSGIVRMANATGLNNTEFLLWGHDGGALGTWGVGDLPTGIQGRWQRVWRVSEVNTSGTAIDVGNVDITFDLSGLGSVTASDLRLLVDTDNDGVFADETPINGATNPSGNNFRFSAVAALTDRVRFTLATINVNATPLPVELIAFTAESDGARAVHTAWTTASEHDNAGFTVQRSMDLENWSDVAHVSGAGNSQSALHYAATDLDPLFGTSFYRLEQTDLDGFRNYSQVVQVVLDTYARPALSPNPATERLLVSGIATSTSIEVYDAIGKRMIVPMVWTNTGAELTTVDLAPGAYVLICSGSSVPLASSFVKQ